MKPLVTYITMAGRVSTDLVDILVTFTYTTQIYLGNRLDRAGPSSENKLEFTEL